MKTFLCVLLATAALAKPAEKSKKSISLFTVVQFPNDECTTKSSKDYMGTCYSSTQCSDMGGVKDGSCGAGFGVCCKFIISATSTTSVTRNCTYIQNKGYPTAVTTVSKSIAYNIKPIGHNICHIRFDFQAMNIAITASTGVCDDTFTIKSPTSKSPPSVCGNNKGYHMYAEVGKMTTNVVATMTTKTTSFSRTWNIKVSQIECDNPNKPPTDCMQYFTKGSGTLESFNFNGGLMVASMDYTVCFKMQSGTCGVRYTVDTGTTSPNPFCLTSNDGTKDQTSSNNCATNAGSRIHCSVNGLLFPGLVTTPADASGLVSAQKKAMTNTLCGTNLNPHDYMTVNAALFAKSYEFQVFHITKNVYKATGFKLNYQQTCHV